MKKMTFCNPLDLEYRYQHMRERAPSAHREGADPTIVAFKGKYYLFASMSAGFWWSQDMVNWQFHSDTELLIYDYAPDARQIGEWLYFCASRKGRNCPILRTRDPLNEPFEEVSCAFDFWDPNIFCDDDGRIYFYWGCTNSDPIWAVELDPDTMTPLGERMPVIFEHDSALGYERCGENGVAETKETSAVYKHLASFYDASSGHLKIPPQMAERMAGFGLADLEKMFHAIGKPYIEGAFMTKHGGRYYLQYATPGTQYNTYCDAVYVGDAPLGPFALQASNPFSSVPGGFITGAGHGSTMEDRHGNWWHASTMRISVNHDFERRVGLFPAGFDKDGMLFCNQAFADYPMHVPEGRLDPWSIGPVWMLLSYRKPVTSSSGDDPQSAVNENIRDWWSAGSPNPGEWLAVDLEKVSDIRAIQVNLADEGIDVDFPFESFGDARHTRHIETRPQISSYKLDVSLDGETWTTIEQVSRECVNGYYEYREGVQARFVRLTGGALPYGQPLRVAGLRVFGVGGGEPPQQARAKARRIGPMDGLVSWEAMERAQGCCVRYGIAPDKLYLSMLVYSANEAKLSTLIKGQRYYVRVDAFNENGITQGDVFCLEENA